MCGIAGIFDPRRAGDPSLTDLVRRMGNAISHRGPDGCGQWIDAHAGYAVSHRRLAIIDLSPGGAQPMVSSCGRYSIAYNGEIYNYQQTRRRLEKDRAIIWRGNSDTEVLVEAIASWGIERALEQARGMFSFAVWDKHERVLTLARDRLGQKPLYFGWVGGTCFAFASELVSLLQHPAFEPEVDRSALVSYLHHTYVPAPYSIYKGIYKLQPGSLLRVDAELVRSRPGIETLLKQVQPYWSIDQVVEQGQVNPVSEDQALSGLEDVIASAVESRLISDVPLGAFLSGGIDSSLVVAYMQRASARPTRTFSIGFREKEYDESGYAEQIARHLGTEHTTFRVTPNDSLDTIQDLSRIYSEPFADSSQIPTYLVSKLARQYVTVAITGDGGDESFGGYRHHRLNAELWSRLRLLPHPLRAILSRCIVGMPRVLVDRTMRAVFSRTIDPSRIAGLLASPGPEAFHVQRMQCFHDPTQYLAGGDCQLSGDLIRSSELDFRQWMMLWDTKCALANDMLVKVDRASMAVSLEARSPLVDHRVVEYAARLPVEIKMRGGQLKWPLRQLLARWIPEELIDRPKRGFAVPIGQWLRVELRSWAEAMLCPTRLGRDGFFEPAAVQSLWQQHLDGAPALHAKLWTILMFQSWLDREMAIGSGEEVLHVQ